MPGVDTISPILNTAERLALRPDDRDRRRRVSADRGVAQWRRTRVRPARRPVYPDNAAGGAGLCRKPSDRRGSGPGDPDRGIERTIEVRGPMLTMHMDLHSDDQYRQGARCAGPAGQRRRHRGVHRRDSRFCAVSARRRPVAGALESRRRAVAFPADTRGFGHGRRVGGRSTPRTRQASGQAANRVTLRDMHGFDSKAVCELLDISIADQRVLLHRGRAAVRQALETYLADES
jgi:hypothetical protein